ncbi:MAG TPA: hypothetical protein VHD56_12410 [Tepidisphaeraceae bacterium]|nr:hypothetical protein [Tepidisphaeraceae bacterium]
MSWNDTEEDEAAHPDDSIDREMPDESDMDDPDGPPLIHCPHCRKMIHEESEWCHYCGQYISAEDNPRETPMWLVVGTMLGLLGVLAGAIAWILQ